MGCINSKEYEFISLTKSAIVSWSWILDPHVTRIPPVRSDHFIPITPLGKGKFGLVFLCQHKSNNNNVNSVNPKFVAVKFIPKSIIFECKCIDRIQHELDIIHILNHPFILHCFGSFDSSASIGNAGYI